MSKMADSEGDSFEANLNEVIEILKENGFERGTLSHKTAFPQETPLAVLPTGYGKSFIFQMNHILL